MFFNCFSFSFIIFVSLLYEITLTNSYEPEAQCEDFDYKDFGGDEGKLEDVFKNTFKSKESIEELELSVSTTTENMSKSVDTRNLRSIKENKTAPKRIVYKYQNIFDSKKYFVRINTCFSCYYDVSFEEDVDNCYEGIGLETVSCGAEENETAICYTELGYNYIRRGCTTNTPDLTFYCRCNLCNDKSATELDNFMYLTWEDMDFDNNLINNNKSNVHLICKQCETKELDDTGDKDEECIEGFDADEGSCLLNQVCATYVSGGGRQVKRGCANRPAYNPWFHYCIGVKCNKKSFYSEPYTRVQSGSVPKAAITKREVKNSSTRCRFSNILLFPLIIFKYYSF